jgi:hypothetical protein
MDGCGPPRRSSLRRADQVDLAFYVLLRGVAGTAAHAYSLNYRMTLQLRRLPSHDGGLRVWPEYGWQVHELAAPRVCTIAGFYRYAVEEKLLDHSPAAHGRRPRLDYESHATALDRNELGALVVAAGLGPPAEHD